MSKHVSELTIEELKRIGGDAVRRAMFENEKFEKNSAKAKKPDVKETSRNLRSSRVEAV